jgi:hypothetical protein
MIPTASLYLTLLVPGAPALKTEKPPQDLIDLLPEDTAAVLALDMPKLARHPVGARIFRGIAGDLADDDLPHPPIEDLAAECQQVVIAQFGIEARVGDFLFLFRLREKATVAKAFLARKRKSDNSNVRPIGRYMVYALIDDAWTATMVDERTMALVLATGDGPQKEQTLEAVYGDRKTRGPSDPVLRKMLAEPWPSDRPALLFGAHPKANLSIGLVLTPLGTDGDTFRDLGADVKSFRGSVALNKTAQVEVRVSLKDEDAARDFVRLLKAKMTSSWLEQMAESVSIAVEKWDVLIRARLSAAWEKLFSNQSE